MRKFRGYLQWMVWIIMAVLTPLGLWACGLWIYTLRPLPELPQPHGKLLNWTASDWEHITIDGERCELANNIWNRNVAGRTFTQEVFVEDVNGERVTGWRWRSPWQMEPTIAAYPEIICGNKPWDEPSVFYKGMPFHPAETRVVAKYQIHMEAQGTYNLAFELWAVDQIPATPERIRGEFMIWLDTHNLHPSGRRAGSINLNGVTWDLWADPKHHDASGNVQNEWAYAAFVPRQAQLTGPLDLTAFLDELRRQKLLSDNEWITSIELGNEVADGTGLAELHNFSLNLTPNSTPGNR